MNYLFISPIYLPHMGGIEKYVYEISNYLVNKGNKVVIFTADRNIEQSTETIEGQVVVYRIPIVSISGILYIKNKNDKKLLNALLLEADVVHLNDCKFLYKYLGMKKAKYNYKLILSSHGFIFHTNTNLFIKKVFFKHVVVRNQEFFDKIICVSPQDYDIACSYGLKKLEIIYPGVNIHKYESLPDKTYSIPTFLYYGRIAVNKGLKECLEKVCKINDFIFNIIGKCDDDEYMNSLNEIIKINKKENNVIFLGRKSDEVIKKYMIESDFILMPSLHEGFGMTLAECLLSNKKIIANTNSSFKEILHNTKAEEFLFDFENKDSDILIKIQELNEKKVIPINVEQYSLENMFLKLEKVYNNN